MRHCLRIDTVGDGGVDKRKGVEREMAVRG